MLVLPLKTLQNFLIPSDTYRQYIGSLLSSGKDDSCLNTLVRWSLSEGASEFLYLALLTTKDITNTLQHMLCLCFLSVLIYHLTSPSHIPQSMSGSGCHLMKSPDLINLNLTWALHEVLSLYEKDMVKFMIKLMKLSLKCKFGCSLYLKKSLSYLHLNFTYPRLFLWCWLQPYSHS